jgi:hypothetical protein
MLHLSKVLPVLMLAWASACPSTTTPAPPEPPPAPPLSPLPPPSAAPAQDIDGVPAEPVGRPARREEPPADAARRYVDNGCGARKYPRHIVWPNDNGGITVEERIAPCPPEARCAWAGVVWHEGTVVQTGAQLALSYANNAKAQGEAPPTALTVEGEGDARVLVETLADGTRCAFKLYGK